MAGMSAEHTSIVVRVVIAVVVLMIIAEQAWGLHPSCEGEKAERRQMQTELASPNLSIHPSIHRQECGHCECQNGGQGRHLGCIRAS